MKEHAEDCKNQTNGKEPYEAPTLRFLGSVEELTSAHVSPKTSETLSAF